MPFKHNEEVKSEEISIPVIETYLGIIAHNIAAQTVIIREMLNLSKENLAYVKERDKKYEECEAKKWEAYIQREVNRQDIKSDDSGAEENISTQSQMASLGKKSIPGTISIKKEKEEKLNEVHKETHNY